MDPLGATGCPLPLQILPHSSHVGLELTTLAMDAASACSSETLGHCKFHYIGRAWPSVVAHCCQLTTLPVLPACPGAARVNAGILSVFGGSLFAQVYETRRALVHDGGEAL